MFFCKPGNSEKTSFNVPVTIVCDTSVPLGVKYSRAIASVRRDVKTKRTARITTNCPEQIAKNLITV